MDRVPCVCPACNGHLVSRYTRRLHAKLCGNFLSESDQQTASSQLKQSMKPDSSKGSKTTGKSSDCMLQDMQCNNELQYQELDPLNNGLWVRSWLCIRMPLIITHLLSGLFQASFFLCVPQNQLVL